MLPLVYYATVTSTKDPLSIGRIQVKLRGFGTDLELKDVWLRMLSPAASAQTGFLWLPEVGDEVAVLRGAGDTIEGMLLLGSLYNGKNKPIYSNDDGDNITKEIRTKAGNLITFTDKAGEEAILIQTASAKVKISIQNKDNGAIIVDGGDKITVSSASEISFESKKVTLKASDTLELGGSTQIKCTGGKVELSGTEIKVSGSGPVAISGPTVNIG